jgi:glucokinase
MNDLEALAHGVLVLPEAAFATLAPGDAARVGGKALVAAGTGLGVALMPRADGKGSGHVVVPTEGGHTDFAPSDADEDELLVFLRARYGAAGGDGHVSWERVVSGLDGFTNLVMFLSATGRIALPAAHAKEIAASATATGPLVGAAAARREPWAVTVVAWFARLYGAACGNVVLGSLALGGLYLGGGVTARLLPHMDKSVFLEAFRAKGRFAHLLDRVPVLALTEPDAALVGAAARASTLAERGE